MELLNLNMKNSFQSNLCGWTRTKLEKCFLIRVNCKLQIRHSCFSS
uniref:Uncharacterized protein n=1 Tax=Arundo donax TaxID=35708 RepID=A0A0A9AJ62_ARUDO